jgi:hypothetical protein
MLLADSSFLFKGERSAVFDRVAAPWLPFKQRNLTLNILTMDPSHSCHTTKFALILYDSTMDGKGKEFEAIQEPTIF